MTQNSSRLLLANRDYSPAVNRGVSMESGFFSSFGTWFLAVIHHWEIIVTIGVIPFGIELFDKLMKWKMPRKLYAVFVVCGFFFATFAAWKEQHEEAFSARAKMADIQGQLDMLKKPILSGEVVMIAVGPAGEHAESCIVSVEVVIKNLGAPTALQKFSLVVKTDGKSIEGEFLPPAHEIELRGDGQFAPRLYFYGEDHMTRSLEDRPILMNVPTHAWFQALVELSRDEFRGKGTKVSFGFSDVATGAEHSIEYEYTGKEKPMLSVDKILRQNKRAKPPYKP